MNARFVAALAALTMLTLALAFVWIYRVFNADQERQLDEALLAEAREEALEIAQAATGELQISARPGPSANDVGPLTKYAVIYDDDGTRLAATSTFADGGPELSTISQALDAPFDLALARERLRAVRVAIPDRTGQTLLLAAPRTDLDGDARLLARAMGVVYAIAVVWTALALSFLVHRFTRLHRRVASVARRVAEGDLAVRVGASPGGAENARLARDLDEMIARLETLVAAQQRFVASAAHEIRSPLTALYGELSNALRRERDAEEYRAVIERGVDLTRDLRHLAESLLELARLGATAHREPERVDLASVARDAIAAVEGGERVELGGEPAEVEGRPLELVGLVRNLVENAVRHTPPGTRVSVRTGANGGRAELTVDDAGPGIDASVRERMFEPFHRGGAARATTSGTGLGLTIARTIARTHGGELTIERSPLGGARLRFELPASPRA